MGNVGLICSSMFCQGHSIRAVPVDMHGKTVIVTGANGGIGYETAKALARWGAHVIVAARNLPKAEEKIKRLEQEFPEISMKAYPLDLADLDSVLHFCQEVEKQELQNRALDVLINNAGVAGLPYGISNNGHELHFATNHLGHFLLATRLRSSLQKAQDPRLVVVSAILHVLEKEATEDFRYKSFHGAIRAYNRSKLANLQFATHFAKLYPEIKVVSLHPGVVATNLLTIQSSWADSLFRHIALNSEQGAQMSLHCATSPEMVPDSFYHNVKGILEPSKEARNPQKCQELWDRSQRLCEQAVGSFQ